MSDKELILELRNKIAVQEVKIADLEQHAKLLTSYSNSLDADISELNERLSMIEASR